MMSCVKHFFAKYLPGNNKKIILAISGGVDSQYLLHEISDFYPKELIYVAHLNHGIRNDCGKDEKLVKDTCKKLDISNVFVRKIDIVKYSKDLKKGIEETGRIKRYEFFRQIYQNVKADFIITAHHQDDLAESIIMNIHRGCSVFGLIGIREVSGDLLRPLLKMSKQKIISESLQNGICWIEDQTNFDKSFLRNDIRHNILADIKQKNPCVLDIFTGLSHTAIMLTNHIKKIFKKKIKEDFINLGDLKEKYYCFMLIRLFYEKYYDFFDYDESWIAELYKFLIKSQKGAIKEFGSSYYLLKSHNKIKIISSKNKSNRLHNLKKLPIPGTAVWGNYNIETSFLKKPIDFKGSNCYRCYLDRLKVSDTIYVRSWKAGDKIRPLGLKGTKNLSDVLIDNKIDLDDKPQIPIFVKNDDIIVWVGGICMADQYKITETTQNIIGISLKKYEKE